MPKNKIEPNFKDKKYKRLLCSNCRAFVVELNLDQKESFYSTCPGCGTQYRIDPPEKLLGEDGHKIIKYGVGGGTFTADLTEEDPKN